MTVHAFAESLDRSHAYAAAPWWEDVYREAFPDFQGMVDARSDGAGQRNGIDRHIIRASGHTVTVGEKVRDTDYQDFFLEFWSSVENRNVGWVAKDLACDFLAYAFAPSGRCYLLPFPLLRRAWVTHHREWCARFPIRDALNQGYTTRGCCVDIDVVLAAVCDAVLIRFTPERQAA